MNDQARSIESAQQARQEIWNTLRNNETIQPTAKQLDHLFAMVVMGQVTDNDFRFVGGNRLLASVRDHEATLRMRERKQSDDIAATEAIKEALVAELAGALNILMSDQQVAMILEATLTAEHSVDLTGHQFQAVSMFFDVLSDSCSAAALSISQGLD